MIDTKLFDEISSRWSRGLPPERLIRIAQTASTDMRIITGEVALLKANETIPSFRDAILGTDSDDDDGFI
ncbi:hypothetical protein ACAF76_010450 [Brevibacillus sp. TJ4]|uniref:hypothetical protein n=1 Tax=Brevibacillus sp. TJ4 TaxID=3234853 RepID=UPI003B9F0690